MIRSRAGRCPSEEAGLSQVGVGKLNRVRASKETKHKESVNKS